LSGLGLGFTPLPSYIPLFEILEKGEESYRKVLEIDAMSEEINGDCLFDIGCALYYRLGLGFYICMYMYAYTYI
jgi:hypothetical protein